MFFWNLKQYKNLNGLKLQPIFEMSARALLCNCFVFVFLQINLISGRFSNIFVLISYAVK